MSPTSNTWHNNIVLVQLLGLSPLLAISQTATKGLALAICSAVVVILATLITRLVEQRIKPSLHFIWILFLTGSLTTLLDLILQIAFFPLHRELGIYVPLISCNLAILIHLEQQYSVSKTTNYFESLLRCVQMIAGLILALTLFSMLREVLIFGTVFRDYALVTSPVGMPVDTALHSRENQYFTFAITQPGAFILLGLVIALQRWITQTAGWAREPQSQPTEKVARARVTGKL